MIRRIALSLLAVGLASCFSLEAMRWGEWTEQDLANSNEAATATFGWINWPGMIVGIDGHGEVATGYKMAKLRAGRHLINYSNHVHDIGHVSGVIQIDLVAGHSYEFKFDTCYWCTPRTYAVWVEDVTSGEIVWGSRPGWPRWYL